MDRINVFSFFICTLCKKFPNKIIEKKFNIFLNINEAEIAEKEKISKLKKVKKIRNRKIIFM